MTTLEPEQADTNVMFWARVRHILDSAIAGLPDGDRRERIDYCRRTGEHGVRMTPGADVTFTWGGRPLAVVGRDLFAEDAYFEPIGSAFIPDAPDDARGLTGE